VLVLPSISEVAPLVISEAGTLKIPTIASDNNDMKDSVLNGFNGWLFSNGDAQALAKQIKYLIAHPY
jgi:glycosyltransferase involved in cell wall biosynthesis